MRIVGAALAVAARVLDQLRDGRHLRGRVWLLLLVTLRRVGNRDGRKLRVLPRRRITNGILAFA